MDNQTTPLVLDLDQHLHRTALLEAIQFLDSLIHSHSRSPIPEYALHLVLQANLRLTYLALHCRTHSETHSEIRSLHRNYQSQLAVRLEQAHSLRPPSIHS